LMEKEAAAKLGEKPRPKLGGQPAHLEPAARSLHSLWLWCAYGEIKVLSSSLRDCRRTRLGLGRSMK
jgi:hypothetical protein